MKSRGCSRLFSLVGSILLVISVVLTMGVHQIKADDIAIIGNLAKDAEVTTEGGENVTGEQLDRYQYYNVTYHWSIPNGTTVKEGDTATFEIPSNIQILKDTSFEIKDSNDHVIGTFYIGEGSRIGTITFNNYIEDNDLTNVHGTLTLTGNGTTTTVNKDWSINKYGWLDQNNKPTWTVVYNPLGKHLSNVVITDTLKGAQVLDKSSIQIQYGTVDDNNQFHATSINTDPVKDGIVSIDDHGFTAKFDQLDTAIQIVYTTTPTTRANVNLDNVVTGESPELGISQDASSVQVGGSGSVSGDIESGSSSTENSSIPNESTESSMSSTSTTESTETNTSSSSMSSTASSAHNSSTTVSNTTNSTSEWPPAATSTTESTKTSTSSWESSTSNIIIESDSGTTSSSLKGNFVNNSATSQTTNNVGKGQSTTINGSTESSKESLPKTGSDERKSIILTTIGVLIIVLLLGLIIYRYHKLH